MICFKIRVKHQRGKRLDKCMYPSQGPCADSQFVLGKLPIVSGSLTQPSNRKQFSSRRKSSLEKGGRQLSVYTSILQICCFKEEGWLYSCLIQLDFHFQKPLLTQRYNHIYHFKIYQVIYYIHFDLETFLCEKLKCLTIKFQMNFFFSLSISFYQLHLQFTHRLLFFKIIQRFCQKIYFRIFYYR